MDFDMVIFLKEYEFEVIELHQRHLKMRTLRLFEMTFPTYPNTPMDVHVFSQHINPPENAPTFFVTVSQAPLSE